MPPASISPAQSVPSGHAALAGGPAAEMNLVRRAVARDGNAFREIMQIHNQRLYRIARSVLRNDAEAEDAVQEAYVRAFTHLDGFRGESRLGTWLSRIVMNEALGQLRKRPTGRDISLTEAREYKADIIPFPLNAGSENPEQTMAQREILRLVEQATDTLPDIYRTVFIARVIEGMSIEETAVLLDIKAKTIKTRLHRARQMLHDQLDKQIGPTLLNAFPFAGRRCARMTEAVMARLGSMN